MPYFSHQGIRFHFRDEGDGAPFVFQHGLGADVNQPFELLAPLANVRLLALDCRARGQTYPLGDSAGISFRSFADDLLAFMDHSRVERAVVGGISMGAGVALRFAVAYPQRVTGLVISRPAWLASPAPSNLAIYDTIAMLIRRYDPMRAAALFAESPEYAELLRTSPDAANSLIGQLRHVRAHEAVIRLERIPHDAPITDLKELQAVRVPTLVLASRQDPVHPFEYAERLAHGIHGAEVHELTPKSISRERHAADTHRAVSQFLGNLKAFNQGHSPHSNS